MGRRVAIVTGSNKGIGFSIVRALCKKFDGDVFLLARDVGRGEQAVKDLQKEGLNPKFHQLDINNKVSIQALKTYLMENYGGLDVLVNNAAIAYPKVCDVPFAEQTKNSMATNYWAFKDNCEILFPILRAHARVVNLASLASWEFTKMCSPANKEKVLSAKTVEAIDKLMTDFEAGAADGTLKANGWPLMGYAATKAGIRLLTSVQMRDMAKDPREDVIINCCCPGLVMTDMNTKTYSKTPDEGAITPVYLALLPAGSKSPIGEYLTELKVQQWQ